MENINFEVNFSLSEGITARAEAKGGAGCGRKSNRLWLLQIDYMTKNTGL